MSLLLTIINDENGCHDCLKSHYSFGNKTCLKNEDGNYSTNFINSNGNIICKYKETKMIRKAWLLHGGLKSR